MNKVSSPASDLRKADFRRRFSTPCCDPPDTRVTPPGAPSDSSGAPQGLDELRRALAAEGSERRNAFEGIVARPLHRRGDRGLVMPFKGASRVPTFGCV